MPDSPSNWPTLGPFRIGRELGKGGMGLVYAAEHVSSGLPVAIKVLDSASISGDHLDSFHREVRAVAGLDHPHIVQIYDFGRITEDSALPGLKAGAPWLAMELCSGGSLAENGPRDWGDLVTIIEQLLSGLSSAHARGVLHRDLKPDNILLSRPPGQGWDLRLVDFGLAFETLTSEGDEGIRGTPRYMAPEQFMATWRRFGPWTDLYAVGCLVWRLVTGESPFGLMSTIQQLARAHCGRQPPVLVPGFRVPAAFENWLLRLLAKDPRGRFIDAAQAGAALQSLSLDTMLEPGPVAAQRLGFHGPGDTLDALSKQALTHMEPAMDEATVQATEEQVYSATLSVTVDDERVDATLAEGRALEWATEVLEVPRSWRAGQWTMDRTPLAGAGLDLLGLRQPPLVDRAIGRDRLWTLLRKTSQKQRPHFLILQGKQGQGKSRLAQWLGERASELGVARLLRVSHCDQPTAASGLEGAIERACQAHELPPQPLRDQLGWHLSGHVGLDSKDLKALSRLMVGDEGLMTTDSQDLAVLVPGERERLLARVLEGLSMGGPLVLWIDDVQWGSDSLTLVKFLMKLRTEQAFPLLVLMTLVPDLVDPNSPEAELLTDLGVERLDVGPLNAADTKQLIMGHLPLVEGLCKDLVRSSRGQPLVAINLVEQLVAEGRLISGANGFELADGDALDLPSDLVALWARRLQQVLGAQAEEALPLLEIASLLGQEAEIQELRMACEEARIAWDPDILDRLDRAGLVGFRASGLVMRFADSQLHHLLVDRAPDTERRRAQHKAIASMLKRRYGAEHGVEAERLALHCREAGEVEEASSAYLVSARHRMRLGEYDRAKNLALKAEDCLKDLMLATGLQDQLHALLGMIAFHRRAFGELGQRAEQAMTAEDPEVSLLGHLLASRYHRVQGNPEMAEELLNGAENLAGEGNYRAVVLADRVNLAQRLGRQDRLKELCQELVLRCDQEKDNRLAGKAHLAAARALSTLKQVADSIGHFRQARDCFFDAGMPLGEADSLNGLGRALAELAQIDEAVDCLAQATKIYASLHHPAEVFPTLTRGVIQLDSGRYIEARKTFEEALVRVRESGRQDLMGPTHAAMIPCAAAVADWESFDQHFGEAEQRLGDSGIVDEDIARPLSLAGNLARARSEDARARQAYLLARSQWERLGRDEAVTEIDEAISLLSDV